MEMSCETSLCNVSVNWVCTKYGEFNETSRTNMGMCSHVCWLSYVLGL